MDQEIPLRRQEWKRKREGGMYAGFIGPSAHWKTCHRNRKGQRKEVIPEDLEHDVRLLKTRMGQYFLCIPVELKRQPPPPQRIIALDPGVRTFLTGYDPSGLVSEWGSGDAQRLFRLCFGLDKLISKTNQKDIRHKQRYRMKKAQLRLRLKIRHLVDNLHHNVAKDLCSKYQTILIPPFETSNMVKKAQRRINAKSVRKMLTWSHFRFRQFLKHKAREYPGCRVLEVDEMFTTQTCGGCGILNRDIGSRKLFECPSCGLVIDRDANAARNILLKHLDKMDLMDCNGVRHWVRI
jgi:putative transposase